MSSARKIAANRRNAQKSSGPRSAGGKRRSSGNAFRHGLSAKASTSSVRHRDQISRLAHQIAGEAADALTFEKAWSAADAHLQFQHIRRIRIAFIENVKLFGVLPAADQKRQNQEAWKSLKDDLEQGRGLIGIDPEATLPPADPERTAEALRRALPELVKLDRFEKRALTRRNQALRTLYQRKDEMR
jgi:hypothetical protein